MHKSDPESDVQKKGKKTQNIFWVLKNKDKPRKLFPTLEMTKVISLQTHQIFLFLGKATTKICIKVLNRTLQK